MDEDLISFAVIYFATYFMVFTVSRRNEVAVRSGLLVFLTMTSFFAPMKVMIFGYASNISAILFAAFIACMTILAIDRGFQYILRIVLVITQWLIYMQFVIFFMTMTGTPSIVKDGFYFNIVAMIINDNSLHSFFATYLSAILATAGISTIVAWCPCKRTLKYLLAVSVASIVSGISFYPIAFTGDPLLPQLMLVSIPIKVLMTVLYFPVVGHMKEEQYDKKFFWELPK